MKQDCLIGYTGFVGGTLARMHQFETQVNSKTVETLRNQHFNLLVCAGVSAVKWQANKEPEVDWQGIQRLVDVLTDVRADEVILISTVDVYPDPASGSDETAIIDASANHAYGRHRLRLEDWISAHFPKVRIVRLPALFGAGLRKNALYDLLHRNMESSINPAALFQWYDMERLWADIAVARQHDLGLINLVPEPLAMSRIIGRFFSTAKVGEARVPAPVYDLHTRFGALFGHANGDGYMQTADSVLAAMERFIAAEHRVLTT